MPDALHASFAAVVFDMDGVLVDSAAFHARAFRDAFAGVPLPRFDYARIAGMRTDEAVALLLSDAGLAAHGDVVQRYVAKKRARYAELCARGGPPMVPGGAAVVRELAASGVPAALASSGSHASVSAFLEASQLGAVFAFALHGGDVTAAKPAPDIYALAALRLRLPPQAVLVVEDSTAGATAARAAGCAVAAYRPTEETRAALARHPHFVIEALGDVAALARGARR